MDETTTAILAAKEAGRILSDNFGRVKSWMKSPKDIVTEADIKAEEVILEILGKEYPDHSIWSEEKGKSLTNSEYMWVVDPLDGTTNYSVKNPFFNVSIALAHRGEIVSGVVYSPITDELFHAEKGKGAFLNEEKIQVSKEAALENLLIVYCHGHSDTDIGRVTRLFPRLKPLFRDFSRMRSGALEHAFVAAGRLGAYISPGGKPMDSAAGILLVTEAGGKATDFEGKPWNVHLDNSDVITSNGVIHEKLLDLVKGI
jgi:myo-inositol-1(or 4)-monophosphatase